GRSRLVSGSLFVEHSRVPRIQTPDRAKAGSGRLTVASTPRSYRELPALPSDHIDEDPAITGIHRWDGLGAVGAVCPATAADGGFGSLVGEGGCSFRDVSYWAVWPRAW